MPTHAGIGKGFAKMIGAWVLCFAIPATILFGIVQISWVQSAFDLYARGVYAVGSTIFPIAPAGASAFIGIGLPGVALYSALRAFRHSQDEALEIVAWAYVVVMVMGGLFFATQ